MLLVGQYSTGKTSFIKQLIGMDYPDIHIGPEPTTDKFIAVVHGEESKTIMGNALTGVDDLPFSGLSSFGSSFLSKFSAAMVPSPILNDVSIIDTPGVLSGEKQVSPPSTNNSLVQLNVQRTSRGYDFGKVCRWFAERSDLILLMFDCSKLDISDEFKSVIEELQPHEDKVHCVLNKVDQLDTENLMRVYGALMYQLGKIFHRAEVPRVCVGSFRDDITNISDARKQDKEDLLTHLKTLPGACNMRKINDIVKRVRLLIVHICILGHLRGKMPYLWGKNSVQLHLMEHLKEIFEDVRRTYSLAEGDFPSVDDFRASLALCDFSKFPLADRRTLNVLQDLLTLEIPRIVSQAVGGIQSEVEVDLKSMTKRQPSLFSFNTVEDYDKRRSNFLLSTLAAIIVVVAVGLAFLFSDPDNLRRFNELIKLD